MTCTSNSVQIAHPHFLNTGEEGGSTSNSVQSAHPHFLNTREEGGSTSNSVQIAHPTFLHTVQAGRTEHSTRYLLHFCSFPSFTKCRPKKLSISYETSMKKLIPSGRPRMSCQDGANRKCISHERSHGFWSVGVRFAAKSGELQRTSLENLPRSRCALFYAFCARRPPCASARQNLSFFYVYSRHRRGLRFERYFTHFV